MLQGPRVASEILAQGPDYTMANQISGPLSGMIDQSHSMAQTYGQGPWSSPFSQDAPGGWELGPNGQFVPTPAPTSGLGSLFNQSRPSQQQQSSQSPQWSNNWLKLASWLTPGEQVPGGPASQWWTGWLKGGW